MRLCPGMAHEDVLGRLIALSRKTLIIDHRTVITTDLPRFPIVTMTAPNDARVDQDPRNFTQRSSPGEHFTGIIIETIIARGLTRYPIDTTTSYMANNL